MGTEVARALSAATAQAAGYNRLVADLTEAIRRKPNFGSAYFARGKTYLTLHQYAYAVQDFTKAIELKPGDATIAYLNRLGVLGDEPTRPGDRRSDGVHPH
jgi:tetratricopeptide (TPR) repeat protein